MSRLFETMRICDGMIQNADLHSDRLNNSRAILFGCSDFIDLKEVVALPSYLESGVYKCRVIYSRAIESVEFTKYQRRIVRSVRLVEDNEIEYEHKYLERTQINTLVDKSGADDILIVKNGCITDASIANVVFYDGKKWITPNTPLLSGTRRRQLLRDGIILEDEIKPQDLRLFSKAVLINAMVGLDEGPSLSMGNIILI